MSDLSVAADGSRLKLLHLHAHPDDESSKGAASTAMYVSQGVEVMIGTFTGGERGSVLNSKMDRPEVHANLAAIRQQEMEAAREILGVEHVAFGFIDSGLPEGDPLPPLPEGCFALTDAREAARGVVELIRSFRPHVVTTYDEKGGYPHPDHVHTHVVSMEAVRLANDPTFMPEAGEPYQVPKVYYHMSFHRRRLAAFDKALHEAGVPSPYRGRLIGWEDMSYEHRVTTQVQCGEFFGVRDDALRAHASQIDPDGPWFATPLEIQQATWPYEDFQLVYSAVPTVLPESDLFAGLRPAPPQPQSFSDLVMV